MRLYAAEESAVKPKSDQFKILMRQIGLFAAWIPGVVRCADQGNLQRFSVMSKRNERRS